MTERGIKKITFSDPAVLDKIEEIGIKARRDLIGKLYTKELLEEMETAIKEFRSKK